MPYVPAAFTDPLPAISQGHIEILLASPGAATEAPPQDSTFAVDAYYSDIARTAQYRVWIPNKFSGRRFAIILTDSAILKDPNVSGKGQDAPSRGCGRGFLPLRIHGEVSYIETSYLFEKCQVVYGTVPRAPNVENTAENCSLVSSARGAFVSFTLTGLSSGRDQLDWVHQMRTLPDLATATGEFPLNTFGSVELDQTYASLGVGPICKTLQLEPNEIFSGGDPEPTASSSGQLAWTGEEASGLNRVITAKRNGTGLGNLVLASAGALVALSVGLIPVAYESWHEWYLNRNERKGWLKSQRGRPLP